MKLINIMKNLHHLIDELAGRDYIVEQGTSGIWTYRKWNSGIAECWGKRFYSGINATITWGNLYAGRISQTPYINNLFIENQNCIAEYELYSTAYGEGWLGKSYTGGLGDENNTPAYNLIRPTSLSGISCYVKYNVKGRWK